jgi:hypothetical protein
MVVTTWNVSMFLTPTKLMSLGTHSPTWAMIIDCTPLAGSHPKRACTQNTQETTIPELPCHVAHQ